MHELEKIFQTNYAIVDSVYGQVFFLMGAAVLLQSRKHSRLALARSLWLLGAFGILHGVSEWGYVFIPIQVTYLPAGAIIYLWLAHAVLEAASFALLFQFGVELTWSAIRQRWLRVVPSVMLSSWAMFFLIPAYSHGPLGAAFVGQMEPFPIVDISARYLIGLPGTIVAGIGLLREARTIHIMDLPHRARYLDLAAWCFFVYGIFAGLVVPPANFFPANVLNYRMLWHSLGLPVEVYRSICGLACTYLVVRALEVFQIETDRKIEMMERERAIALERQRIGRELHDGTIQSIYAAGLAIEDLAYTIGENAALAREKTGQVMDSLNRAIAEIRNYILDLQPLMDNGEFEEQLAALANEFTGRVGVEANLQIDSRLRRPIDSDQAAHLLQVAREALANVARHAGASHVAVVLAYGRDGVTLEVRDDGRGFEPKLLADPATPGQGLGLRNLEKRMKMLGGALRVEAALHAGTKMRAEVPFVRAAK